MSNPLGLVYNPKSLGEVLDFLWQKPFQPEKEMFCHKGLWRHPLVHSSLSHPDRDTYQKKVELAIKKAQEQLKRAKVLIITLGTDQGYYHRSSQRLYSNCHTLPGKDFIRRPIDLEEEAQIWQARHQGLRKLNDKLTLIFSLSPVRYHQKSVEENSLGKARLRLFIEGIKPHYGPQALYFPAYEMAMDLLRDYRFYGDDRRHLSPAAVDWIYQVFCQWLYDAQGQVYLHRSSGVRNMLRHRVLFPDTEEGQAFLAKRQKSLEDLVKDYPWSSLGQWEANSLIDKTNDLFMT
jgi:hypothetical protein